MTETVQIWLFAGAFGAIVALAGWMSSMKVSLAKQETTLNVLINMLGKRAAGILHSPHTPEHDVLIEKFQGDNITAVEMQEFCDRLLIIEADVTLTKGERLLATLVLLAVEQMNAKRQPGLNVGNSKARRTMNPNEKAP